MKKILNVFRKRNLKNPFQGAKHEACILHNTNRYPNIKANEHCLSCSVDLCYLCGNKHIENNCLVSWGQDNNIDLLQTEYSKTSNQKVILFNQGYLGVLHLNNLKCSCGKKLEASNEKAAICVACGTATCSNECHHSYLQQNQLCVFNHNFLEDFKEKSLRSLSLKNVQILQDKNLGTGTPVCKTSNYFIKGYLSEHKDQIFVQRGFRQYGNPQDSTLDNLEIFNEQNIDYVLNTSKKCSCQCSTCIERSIHPTLNCENDCDYFESMDKESILNFDHLQENCQCNCPFCSSGKIILKHSKLDCLYHCHNSSHSKDYKYN